VAKRTVSLKSATIDEVMCRVLGLGSAFIYLTLRNSKRNDNFRTSEAKRDF